MRGNAERVEEKGRKKKITWGKKEREEGRQDSGTPLYLYK